MEHEAGMTLQPSPHLGMLMSPVVIHDQMQWNLARELLVDGAQEFQELLMAMPLIALTNHLPLQRLQRSEKGRSAVTLVIVGHCSSSAWF